MARPQIVGFALGIVGAMVGGAAGYFVFSLLLQNGFYAMVLPGTLIGLGCGLLSGMKSNLLGMICAATALLLGIYTEGHLLPFVADDSFAFFVANLHHLPLTHMIMIALGALFAFWFGKGRRQGSWLRPAPRSEPPS